MIYHSNEVRFITRGNRRHTHGSNRLSRILGNELHLRLWGGEIRGRRGRCPRYTHLAD